MIATRWLWSLALLAVLAGCIAQADDDDSAGDDGVTGTWTGVHAGPDVEGLLVELDGASTLTDADGAWELPSPGSVPAQLHVYTETTEVRGRIACSSGVETGVAVGSVSWPKGLGTLRVNVRGWELGDELFGVNTVLYTDEDDQRWRRTTTISPQNFELSEPGVLTGEMSVPVGDSLSLAVYSTRAGRLIAFALEEDLGETDGFGTLTFDLTLDDSAVGTVSWDGEVPSGVTEIELQQYIPFGTGSLRLPLYSREPAGIPLTLPVVLTGEGEYSMRAAATMSQSPGCSGPSSGRRFMLDTTADLSVPPLLQPIGIEPVSGSWTGRDEVRLTFGDSPEFTEYSVYVGASEVDINWRLSGTSDCLLDTLSWPESLPSIPGSTSLLASTTASDDDGGTAYCFEFSETEAD